MIITDIQRQKHNDKRFSVFVDGEYTFSVSDVDLLYYKLRVGCEISAERLNEIAESNAYARAKDIALKFLGYRMRSEREIVQRLRREELPPEAVERALDFLKKYGYIDDRRFAESFINEKKRLKGYGGMRLKQELFAKGISREIIDEFSGLMSEDSESLIRAAIEKKLGGRRIEDRKEEQRLMGFLARRGFSFEDIREAIREYKNPDEFEEDNGEWL